MKVAATVLLVVALASATNLSKDASWKVFKATHGKVYPTLGEESFRRALFEKTVTEVRDHNRLFLSGLQTYSMAVNRFADMLPSEVVGAPLKYEENAPQDDAFLWNKTEHEGGVDWREVPGVVHPVVNQGACASAWVFSAVETVEGQMMLVKKVGDALSVQQVLECAKGAGCQGGQLSDAFEYITKFGLESEKSYPNSGKVDECHYDASKVIAKVEKFNQVMPVGSEKRLLNRISAVGPISVAIHVNSNFLRYSGGVYFDKSCGTTGLNHALLVVGYGRVDTDGQWYYIVKNSWGSSWGEAGYIKMAALADNMCGIASYAHYPTLQ